MRRALSSACASLKVPTHQRPSTSCGRLSTIARSIEKPSSPVGNHVRVALMAKQRKMNTRLSLSALTILLLAACGDDSGDTRLALRQSDQPGHRSYIRSMDDLRQVMVMGMSTNDIVSILGNPDLTDNVGKGIGIHEWRYFISSFPADDEMKGSYVVGLVLGLTNGNLAKWTCAYATPSELTEVQTPSPVNGRGPTETRLEARSKLKFFLVSHEPIPGGRSIDTEQLPKLGFIPPAPSLIVSTVKKVSWQEQSFT